ncbi:Nuclear pore complex protein Nup50 [Taenia crassiceps]|uniref:Nuclear pore complex protein Nup50 n=1 Tax=Taenia crassiceps TaxID=6207 RepID=A0ABR4QQF4_9CEST
MSKRGADKPLDYDNWDAPDEPVKPGIFEKADEATIKARNIIIARRKSGLPVAQTKRGLFKTLDAFGSPQARTSPTPFITSPKSEPKDDDYLSKLAVLNKEHLATIESSTGEVISGKQATQSAAAPASTSATMEGLVVPESKVSLLQPVSTTATTTSNGFGFKFQTASPTEPAASKPPLYPFGFASSAGSNAPPPLNPKMFSFASAPVKQAEDSVPSTTTSVTGTDQGDEEEYVPPKPEVREIKEEGSVYTVRCKLFYKRADQWTERGLGNLHIIPSGDEKFQLLVRADTNLGNILLNIMVTKDIPMQLQKNNITFACVPSPPLPGNTKTEGEDAVSPPRPVPMLIRVKSAEAAENLLTEIDKYRGKK